MSSTPSQPLLGQESPKQRGKLLTQNTPRGRAWKGCGEVLASAGGASSACGQSVSLVTRAMASFSFNRQLVSVAMRNFCQVGTASGMLFRISSMGNGMAQTGFPLIMRLDE